jgi:hypothetical protein
MRPGFFLEIQLVDADDVSKNDPMGERLVPFDGLSTKQVVETDGAQITVEFRRPRAPNSTPEASVPR